MYCATYVVDLNGKMSLEQKIELLKYGFIITESNSRVMVLSTSPEKISNLDFVTEVTRHCIENQNKEINLPRISDLPTASNNLIKKLQSWRQSYHNRQVGI